MEKLIEKVKALKDAVIESEKVFNDTNHSVNYSYPKGIGALNLIKNAKSNT